MSIQNRDYHKDVAISGSLQKQWEDQASIYMYYAEALADAILDKDKLKAALDLAKAELDKQIIDNWQKVFDSKPTEALRDGWVIRQPRYKKSLEEYNEAVHTVNLLQSARSALEHKKKALESLVTLKVTGMYSEPKVQKTITQGGHLGLVGARRMLRRIKRT